MTSNLLKTQHNVEKLLSFIYDLYAKPFKLAVLSAIILSLWILRKKEGDNWLKGILLACLITELAVPVLRHLDFYDGLFQSLSVVVHHSLWLLLLANGISDRFLKFCVPFFLVGSTLYLLTSESVRFNYYIFIIGALIYILFFVIANFKRLDNEDLLFFFSDQYLLLFSPVFFFLGMSLMFAFGSPEITGAEFCGIRVYKILNPFANVIYYSLILIYTYRTKNQ